MTLEAPVETPGVSERAEASVVISYRNELLGQGIAARLRDRGIKVLALPQDDRDSTVVALADRPTVLVAEWLSPECQAAIEALSPTTRIVDIGAVIGRGCQDAAEMVGFDAILAALGSG